MKLMLVFSTLVLAGCVATPVRTVRSAPPEQTSPSPFGNNSRASSVGVFTDHAHDSIKQQ